MILFKPIVLAENVENCNKNQAWFFLACLLASFLINQLRFCFKRLMAVVVDLTFGLAIGGIMSRAFKVVVNKVETFFQAIPLQVNQTQLSDWLI